MGDGDFPETPTVTPSATASPMQTSTPTPTESPYITPTNDNLLPTNTPSPEAIVIFDEEEVKEELNQLLLDAKDSALEFIDDFSLFPEEPDPLYPNDWLTPLEGSPQTAPAAQLLRKVLTAIGTLFDVARFMDYHRYDPIYPLYEPVPSEPEENPGD